jgi:hypothetical protein
MLTVHKLLVRQGDALYEVLDMFNTESFYNEEKLLKQTALDFFKEHLKADIVLKNGPKMYFCKKIDELEFEMVNTDVTVTAQD